MNYEKSCGAIIYKYENKELYILILKHNAGHFSFPKGHIEEGETEQETAIREVKEETNLSIKLNTHFRYVTTYSPKENTIKDVVYFLATPLNTKIIPQKEEIEKIEWLTKEQAIKTVTYKDDIKVLKNALNYIKKLNL